MPQTTEEKVETLLESVEEIAVAASHELRDRLREALQFSDEYVTSGGGDPKALLDKINTCIRDTLGNAEVVRDYAYLILNTEPVSSCDVNAVIGKSIAACHPLIQKKAAAVSSDTLPTISGRPTQLEMLFTQVIRNALQYNESTPPKVHISVEDEGDAWRFRVSDNGTGVDEDMELLIVGLFRRGVDDTHPVPGKGAGLTMARKAAQNHGGSLQLQSEMGKGTQLFITLPKQA